MRAKQKSYDNYFVLRGCVRQYVIKDGDEWVSNFYTEEDWILPAIDQTNNSLSQYYLECVEDCVLVLGNENEGSKLMKSNRIYQDLAQIILEKEIMKQQQHFMEYQNSTPEERYMKLQKIKTQPY